MKINSTAYQLSCIIRENHPDFSVIEHKEQYNMLIGYYQDFKKSKYGIDKSFGNKWQRLVLYVQNSILLPEEIKSRIS